MSTTATLERLQQDSAERGEPTAPPACDLNGLKYETDKLIGAFQECYRDFFSALYFVELLKSQPLQELLKRHGADRLVGALQERRQQTAQCNTTPILGTTILHSDPALQFWFGKLTPCDFSRFGRNLLDGKTLDGIEAEAGQVAEKIQAALSRSARGLDLRINEAIASVRSQLLALPMHDDFLPIDMTTHEQEARACHARLAATLADLKTLRASLQQACLIPADPEPSPVRKPRQENDGHHRVRHPR